MKGYQLKITIKGSKPLYGDAWWCRSSLHFASSIRRFRGPLAGVITICTSLSLRNRGCL